MAQSTIDDACNVFTIGFTQKSAEDFFKLINTNGIKLLVDVRLNNQSQLAGFTKKNNLKYFLKTISSCSYVHKPQFAPTDKILADYKKKKIDWAAYEKQYICLLKERKSINDFDLKTYNMSCFLCSEASPKQCHRRLLVEYFKNEFSNITITHL